VCCLQFPKGAVQLPPVVASQLCAKTVIHSAEQQAEEGMSHVTVRMAHRKSGTG